MENKYCFWDTIKDRAVVVRFPHYGNGYVEYKGITVDCDMPMTDRMYEGWRKNENHYTPDYHREKVLPMLGKLLGFRFDMKDFWLEDRKTGEGYDISMLYPVTEYRYDAVCFTDGERLEDVGYGDLVHCGTRSEYHMMYRYGHKRSRLINKTLGKGETLLISGDSHLIPDIMPMSIYFKEIWYLDNRDKGTMAEELKKGKFDKVLLEIGSVGLEQYTKMNFK